MIGWAGIDWRDPDGRARRGVALSSTARWTFAAATVVIAHGAGAWIAANWRPIERLQADPPPAIQIDLSPLAVAPEAAPQDVAPGPQMTEAQPAETPETTPVENAPDPPPTPVEPQEPVKPDATPDKTPAPPTAPAPERDKGQAVLAPPPPPKPRTQKPPPPNKRPIERRKPLNPDKPKQRRTSAPPTSVASRSDRAAAPTSGSDSAPSVSPATWKSALMSHLNRYKRYPSGGRASGTASVAFSIDRSGRVLSARLIASSGDPVLDAEAASLPRRASPVPAPPPNIGGGSITLSVPIRFGR